ncbi:hypothetical protein BH11PSE10_BH11PSE10_17090 [soil metagenome]
MNTTLERFKTSSTAAPQRFDLYGNIHKALRSLMADTLIRIGRLDATDEAEVKADLAQLEALLQLCLSHIHHENDFIHSAIEARRPAAATRTANDHHDHLEHIAALQADAFELRYSEAPARAVLAQRLYAHLALFVADNLQHMHIEETVNNTALWALYNDAELIAIHESLLASIGPAEQMLAARWMLPAITPAERAALLGKLQSKMPAEPFAGLLAILQGQLDLGAWSKLALALGLVQQPGLVHCSAGATS